VAVSGHVAKRVAETTEDTTTAALRIGFTINASKTKIISKRNKSGNEPEKIETDRQTEIQKQRNL
jgi:hypothetical protein